MRDYLRLVKFSHTVFALPFALLGFTLGLLDSGYFSWILLILILLCMVFARNTAMAFNRYADRKFDALNQRTKNRELPSGILSPEKVKWFIILNCVAFWVSTWFINSLCFFLAPVALAVIIGYSYTKRFSWTSHLILGLALALAPTGAYIAVTGTISPLILWYAMMVWFWVAGFDIIYALQDIAFDREHTLYSIPSVFGTDRAVLISRLLHAMVSAIVIISGSLIIREYPAWNVGVVIASSFFIIMLIYQHYQIKDLEMEKINLAFFTANGIASVIYCGLVIISLFL